MKPPLVRRLQQTPHKERGVTMVLVAVAMIAMIAMAALSIDLVTLYLAREEAQRAADAAALAAARVLSLSGVTGDPNNIQGNLARGPWPAACDLATQLAQTVAGQNSVGRTAATLVNVTFQYNGTTTDCTTANGGGFAVNPQVQVQVVRQNLPSFFSRIWGRTTNSVSATATAEAFNPSGSGSLPNGMVPVSPRCVKPWILPNKDPNGGNQFFNADGSIGNAGINPGVIGEYIAMSSACASGVPNCKMSSGTPPPGSYIPALITTPFTAVPACANDDYQQAIAGCDQSTVYACGTVNGAQADLTINPGGPTGDTSTATQCLIHQSGGTGQDSMDYSGTTFPFPITAGAGNPIISSGLISISNSIVTIPIYDGTPLQNGSKPDVTIVGFLQVFIDNVDPTTGNINLHVLNVAGCSSTASNLPVNGSSPVPVRLITPQ
jgi:Flp pilus assembly protein TadG